MLNAHSSTQVTRYVGIDVASDSFVAAFADRRPHKFSMCEKGVLQLFEWLRDEDPVSSLTAAMEHTGAYSKQLAGLLYPLGIASVMLDARRVREYASSGGVRTKTDNLDARAILAYAQHYSPQPRVRSSLAEEQLRVLMKRRELLVSQRTALNNQMRSHTLMPECRELSAEPLVRVLQALEQSIEELESQLRQLITADEALSHADAILQSIPGMGPVISQMLCSRLSIIMDCNEKQLTALFGLAARHHQSNNVFRNKGVDKQGYREGRSLLFMGGRTAVRINPRFKAFKERLMERGKPGKLASVAVARKLLTLAHALLRKGEMFEKEYSAA